MTNIWEDILKVEVIKSEQFEKKAKYLLDTYKCFTESDKCVPPKWIQKKKNLEYKQQFEKVERKKIGSKELSIESITRKEFMSCMNKLTLTNKNIVLKNIGNIIRKDYTALYIDILWDLMQRAPEFRNIYFEVFKLLDTQQMMEKWATIWDSYYNKKSWLPAPEILNDNEDYDEFCDFVKWKKRALASIHVWIMLYQKGILENYIINQLIKEIVSDCNIEFENIVEKQSDAVATDVGASDVGSSDVGAGVEVVEVVTSVKKVDVLLEQIIILINFTKTEQDDYFIELIKKWLPKSDKIKSSTRFKLYDINEILQGKMKSVYKVRKGI